MNETPDWLREVYGILQPIITMLVTTVGPIFVGWVALKFTNALQIKSDKDKAEMEKALRDAIHASASNAWVFALKRLGLSFNDLSKMDDNQLLTALKTAKDYVQDKNPEGLEKLNVNGQQLEDILLTKLPTARQ
jgi:hypothetical protein